MAKSKEENFQIYTKLVFCKSIGDNDKLNLVKISNRRNTFIIQKSMIAVDKK